MASQMPCAVELVPLRLGWLAKTALNKAVCVAEVKPPFQFPATPQLAVPPFHVELAA